MNISIPKDMKNKYIVFILLGILVLVLFLPADARQDLDTLETNEFQTGEMEVQLERVLSAMEGVGKVIVMITTEEEQGSLFTDQKKSPKVCGVVVVAEGAGNASVNMRISDAVKALFSVDAHKISIVKMRSQEDDR